MVCDALEPVPPVRQTGQFSLVSVNGLSPIDACFYFGVFLPTMFMSMV